MRFVIFDDETMEPITVVNLPGVAERDICERLGRRIRLTPKLEAWTVTAGHPPPPVSRPRYVECWFEQFVRKGKTTIMCFTSQAGLALLLKPDFLPGQRGAVSHLEEGNRRLAAMLLAAISG